MLPIVKRVFVFFTLFFTVFSVFAGEIKPKTLRFASGLAKPPFIMEDQQHGLQLDLIREALATQSISVSFEPMPAHRTLTALQRFDIDAIAILSGEIEYQGIYLSEPYINYQNVAVSLANKNYHIQSIKDLSGKSIVAFQNAQKFLGQTYYDVTRYSLDYREVAEQFEQAEMLFDGRAEVVVMDFRILQYFIKFDRKQAFQDDITVFPIFPIKSYRAGFVNEHDMLNFNLGISKIKESGVYQRIIDSYIKR